MSLIKFALPREGNVKLKTAKPNCKSKRKVLPFLLVTKYQPSRCSKMLKNFEIFFRKYIFLFGYVGFFSKVFFTFEKKKVTTVEKTPNYFSLSREIWINCHCIHAY